MKIIIYKISCVKKNIKKIYIGSTKNINKRIQYHKYATHNKNDVKYNRDMYKYIRKHGGFKKWNVEILKTWNVPNNKVQRLIERQYINYYNPELNVNSPIDAKYCTNIDLYFPLIYKIACLFSSSSNYTYL